jgi:hypothetical protein
MQGSFAAIIEAASRTLVAVTDSQLDVDEVLWRKLMLASPS